MCGITGFLSKRPEAKAALHAHVSAMCSSLAHRGPDSSGTWIDADRGIALGHRRLAIVDLSEHGRQPMVSACGRYVVAFNGEIYNHVALRRQLGPVAWRGHSDTETLLACISAMGIAAALERLVGMFAIAVWDRQQHKLALVRDRMGEKPLYHGRLPAGDYVFGSELKALRAHPRWRADIDTDSLALFMQYGTVPSPRSIYTGISKVPPGTWVEISVDGTVHQHRYWSLQDVAARAHTQGAAQPMRDEEAVERLESVLSEGIKGQMIADVPLGAFLSGGVDSSTVVALMCKHSTTPVRTFSIGFSEMGFDEAAHAAAVARHLGTSHTELYVGPRDALAVIPRLPAIYDEPFADSSQIPTLLVSQLARRHVTVALSGDGGDELFAGYNRHLLAERVWPRIARLPLPLRRMASRLILAVGPESYNATAAALGRVVPALGRQGAVGDKLHKFASSVLPSRDSNDMYRALVSHWKAPSRLVLGGTESPAVFDDPALELPGASAAEQMCLLDQATYLPDDILVKVDRAAMAASLETRVPLLDHRVVEFSWQVPMSRKIRGGRTKWLLRQVLYRHVPAELVNRPKQGFAIPLDQWLRGPLRDWAQALIEPARLRSEGLLDDRQVTEKWQQHLRGERNWQPLLWDVLMFQAWRESVITEAAQPAQAPVPLSA
jgi:asparagine synthase (glutamine-hydrolysing)